MYPSGSFVLNWYGVELEGDGSHLGDEFLEFRLFDEFFY